MSGGLSLMYRNSLKQNNNQLPLDFNGKISLRINDSIDTSVAPVEGENSQKTKYNLATVLDYLQTQEYC